MKTISTALAQPLAGEVTTLATCWKIFRRDRIVLGFTDHVRDLEVDGVTYKAASHHNAHGNSAAPEPNPTSTRLPALPSSTETK